MLSLARSVDCHRPPQLVIVVGLEELPRLRLVADTYDDEQRLRLWLDSSRPIRELVEQARALERRAA
jgi:hypothetical protein